MHNQAYIFIIFLLNGFLIGILFDIFRILRKSFKTPDFITNLEDIIFWLLTGLMLLYSIFKFNNGEIRGYIFLGLILGLLIYLLIFSKIFIKTNVYIINVFKRIFYMIFVIPIKFIFKHIKKIFFNPMSFIFINIRKSMSKITINIINLYNKKKKAVAKKDF